MNFIKIILVMLSMAVMSDDEYYISDSFIARIKGNKIWLIKVEEEEDMVRININRFNHHPVLKARIKIQSKRVSEDRYYRKKLRMERRVFDIMKRV